LVRSAKWTAQTTAAGVSVGVTKLNQSIDANPTLKNARDATMTSVLGATAYVSGWLGWGKKNSAPEESKEVKQEPLEDGIVEGLPVATDEPVKAHASEGDK
jgi:hypothetical protein